MSLEICLCTGECLFRNKVIERVRANPEYEVEGPGCILKKVGTGKQRLLPERRNSREL